MYLHVGKNWMERQEKYKWMGKTDFLAMGIVSFVVYSVLLK